MLDKLKNGDKILISEGCTHHRQCGDIGTVKIPKWIREYTGKELLFETTSGTEFPADLSPYKMVVHCGGCMLNEDSAGEVKRAESTNDKLWDTDRIYAWNIKKKRGNIPGDR